MCSSVTCRRWKHYHRSESLPIAAVACRLASNLHDVRLSSTQISANSLTLDTPIWARACGSGILLTKVLSSFGFVAASVALSYRLYLKWWALRKHFNYFTRVLMLRLCTLLLLLCIYAYVCCVFANVTSCCNILRIFVLKLLFHFLSVCSQRGGYTRDVCGNLSEQLCKAG